MGVDAEMVIEVPFPVTSADVRKWAYRLGEAVGPRYFFTANDEDTAKAAAAGREPRRALNLYVPGQPDEWGDTDTRYCLHGVEPQDGKQYLWVSLWGRYYGPDYERGNPWIYLAVAEWCDRNLPGCVVYYGGDAEDITRFGPAQRAALIAHWALNGHIPYNSHFDQRSTKAPVCPSCQERACQFGTGGSFASWTCLGCGRHWVWVGGYDAPKAFGMSDDFDSFDAAKEMREALNANG